MFRMHSFQYLDESEGFPQCKYNGKSTVILKLYSLLRSADLLIFINSEMSYILNYMLVKRVEKKRSLDKDY